MQAIYVCSLLVGAAVLILVSVDSARGESDLVIRCREDCANVTSLQGLRRFSYDLEVGVYLREGNLIGHEKGMTYEEASQCLNVGVEAYRNVLMYLHYHLDTATNGGSCIQEHIDGIVALDKLLSGTEKEPSCLAPIWNQYVGENLIKCKKSLPAKLEFAEKIGGGFMESYLKNILQVAQYFNWQLDGNGNLVRDNPKTYNMQEKSLDEASQLLGTTGELTELVRVAQLPDSSHLFAKQPHHDIKLTTFQHLKVQEMLDQCLIMEKTAILKPLVDIMSLGYQTNAGDDEIAAYPHIKVWIAAGEMCYLMKHVQVVEMGKNKKNDKIRLRLKAGRKYRKDNIDELMCKAYAKSSYLVWQKDGRRKLGDEEIGLILGMQTNWKETDKFEEFSGEFSSRMELAEDPEELPKRINLHEISKGRFLKNVAMGFQSF